MLCLACLGIKMNPSVPKNSHCHPSIPMASLCLPDDGGNEHKGALKTPQAISRFHTGPSLIPIRPARGRADISPRWFAQPVRPSDGTVGGSSSGSRSIRLFRFRGRHTRESCSGGKTGATEKKSRPEGQQVVSEAFRGEFNQKVDGKARVSIPASFRRVLEAGDPAAAEGGRPKLVMVYGGPDRQFVECYTIAEMKRVEARIRRIPNFSIIRQLAILLSLVWPYILFMPRRVKP